MLASFIDHYKNKKDAAARIAFLYRKEFKRNMIFSLEHIGYQPTFEFYAEVLAGTGFGTFGFFDVFDAWVAASQNLESALNLLSASKQIVLEKNW